MGKKKVTEITGINFSDRGSLYTRVQGFIFFVLGIVGLRYFLPYIGINVDLALIRTVFFFGFIAFGIIGSTSLFFKGLGRVISGKVEE